MSLLPANTASIDGSMYNYYSAPQKWILGPWAGQGGVNSSSPVSTIITTSKPLAPGTYLVSLSINIRADTDTGTPNNDLARLTCYVLDEAGYTTANQTLVVGALSTAVGNLQISTLTGFMVIPKTTSSIGLNINILGTRTYTIATGASAFLDSPTGVMIQPISPFTQDPTSV